MDGQRINLRHLSWMALALAVVAGILLGGSGTGVRLGWWSFSTGFGILRWSAYLGIAAAGAALILLLIAKARAGRVVLLVATLIVGAGVAYVPLHWMQQARAAPPIHDITTDTDNPPAFAAVLPLRADARNPAAYDRRVADVQRKGYPDIRPLDLALAPEAAFAKALDAAKDMGWAIAAADAKTGRIEATATTMFFGFKDDVVVRITPTPGGSRIDVRSLSRVGGSDVGTNARRIREYLGKLRPPA